MWGKFLISMFGLALLGEGSTLPSAMFPRIIMLYGDSAGSGRYYLTETMDLVGFTRALDSVPVSVPVDVTTPHLNVAIYWHNPTWDSFARDTTLLRTLPLPFQPGAPSKPRSREELGRGWVEGGRLFLLPNEQGPVFQCDDCLIGKGTMRLSPAGIEILRRHKVPLMAARRGE